MSAYIKVQPIFKCKVCGSLPNIKGPDLDTENQEYTCEIACPKCIDRGFLSSSPHKGYVVSGTIQYWNYMNF